MTQAKKSVARRVAESLSAQPEIGSKIVRLSDPQMRPFIEEMKRRIADEPGFGTQLLRSARIVTAKGKLAKPFGG